jgi:hypothetical protein
MNYYLNEQTTLIIPNDSAAINYKWYLNSGDGYKTRITVPRRAGTLNEIPRKIRSGKNGTVPQLAFDLDLRRFLEGYTQYPQFMYKKRNFKNDFTRPPEWMLQAPPKWNIYGMKSRYVGVELKWYTKKTVIVRPVINGKLIDGEQEILFEEKDYRYYDDFRRQVLPAETAAAEIYEAKALELYGTELPLNWLKSLGINNKLEQELYI